MSLGVLGVYVCLFLGLYFEVFLLITFFEKRPAKKTSLLPKYYPTVAVLVPSFNEERTLKATVLSLLKLTYPASKLSVVIIDDGSTDNTPTIGEALARTHAQVQYFRKPNGGKYTALNFGITHVDAELVGCLDADSFVEPEALIEVVKQFENDPTTMAITPVMKVFRPRKLLELMQSVEYTFGIFFKKMFDNMAALNVLPGPFSIYRKEVFEQIGLFRHAHNTEDMEIAFRMHANGLKISNAHTALVYTTVPSTLRTLLKQRTRWSQGFLQNAKDYKYMLFNPRFGHFGFIVLPFGLAAFFAGLYTASFILFNLLSQTFNRIYTMWVTGIPPRLSLPTLNFDWFYLDTSMMTFLIITVLGLTVTAILLGRSIGKSEVTVKSVVAYFALFGFIAPLWLARATWGALRAQEASWR